MSRSGRRQAADAIELAVPPRPEYLQLVRAVVGATNAVDESPLLVPGRVADLRLVVSEAVTNAIEAHLAVGTLERIVVRCRPDGGRIVVEVVDHGAGFEPDGVPELPPVDEEERLRHESGLGLSLMERLADDTAVESGPDGTLVRLTVGPA